MAHPLDVPRARIIRARSRIDTLHEAAEGFIRSNDYRVVVAEYDARSEYYALRVRSGGNTPPLEWSVTIGEVAHNLRSALDGLTWQLALLTTRRPYARTQFPIFSVGKTARKGRRPSFEYEGRRMIRDLRAEHQAAIEKVQPCKRREYPRRRNSLLCLSELNNADKRRLIQVVATLPMAYSWGGWGRGQRWISR